MRWLTGLIPAEERDRGASTVVVVVLLSAFLLGLGAIVTDVGSWYVQRAQTQNGADAGALAVAQTCASGDCNLTIAAMHAPLNSNDTMDISAVVSAGFPCGRAPDSDTALPPCPAGSEGSLCPAPPADPAAPYVDVQVETSDLVMPIFGRLLDPNDNGKRILACAQASWGPPTGMANAVAVTISACEWLKNTADGTAFADVPEDGSYGAAPPAYTNPPTYLDTITARRNDSAYDLVPGNPATNFYVASGQGGKGIYDPRNPKTGYTPSPLPPSNATVAGSETVITPKGFGNLCNAGNPGWAAPGEFSWLSNDDCMVSIDNDTYPGVPGASTAPCEEAFTASRDERKAIFLPVYRSVVGNVYTLEGFAAFVVTGWDMTKASANNWAVKLAPSLIALADTGLPAADANYCGAKYTGSNADICIYGYFTRALIPASALPSGGGGNDLGATAPYLTG